MTKKYAILSFFAISLFVFFSCTDQDDEEEYIPISPVIVDLTQVPYPNLSDYHFFEGEMKNQVPSLNVLPYEPISSLFTDYAHKKRFIWLPNGMKATYNGDDQILDLPVGAVLIKTFYYDNVQPSNTTKIIETRIMIRKSDGWIFADYVWNDEQTEAYLDLNGSTKNITFKDENDVTRTVDYRIPNESQCIVCHKTKSYENGNYVQKNIPIGIKPQNLNSLFNYGNETKNQLTKWIDTGILTNDFSLPSETNTIVDYNDSTKPLEKRVRSYFDINCAHCHKEHGHCDYRPMKFAFSETYNNLTNMGVCVDTQDMQNFEPALSKLVTPGNIYRSMLYHRLNTVDETYRMPLHGRTVIHEEGVLLVEEWINSLTTPCN
ncbi:hypothetical protein GFJ94_11475 [Flavobacterium sp. LMO8]|uniref:hypothetical protein n=1 Tax=Flavobacterium sp. LMO8 TaxID=2654244 RepID=UPI001292079E|nr:hypothetical protein [Flavobacterium sp. LMO8]MQP25683.1 hypothetical protein [Flavobacterium sp. LMO8]